jgi:hypothetical protein
LASISAESEGKDPNATKAFAKGKDKWVYRTSTIVIHLTPQEKEQAKAILEASQFQNWQQAFVEFVRQQDGTAFITEAQSKYLETRRKTSALAHRLGRKKAEFLLMKFKSLGGLPDGSNHEVVFASLVPMLKDTKGITLEDLIVFKQFAASWNEVKVLEGQITDAAASLVKVRKEQETKANATLAEGSMGEHQGDAPRPSLPADGQSQG